MKKLTAEEFDQLADSGQDMSEYLDWDNATRGDTKRINVDIPIEFLVALDREALRRGITRQSLIKVWLYDRLFPTVGVNLLTPSSGNTWTLGVGVGGAGGLPATLPEDPSKSTEELLKNR